MSFAYNEYVPCRYSTQKDLMDRISDTVCRYDGVPVWVQYYDGSKVTIWNLIGKASGPIKTINYDDPLFDISMFECTYLNFTYEEKLVKRGLTEANNVLYLTRDPQKNWKQGFCINYTQLLDISGETSNVDKHYVNRSQGMYDAFTRSFPSYEEAMAKFKTVKLGCHSEVAITPDIALRRSEVGVTFVFYRTVMVGWMEPGSSKIKLVESDLGWVVERYLKRLSII